MYNVSNCLIQLWVLGRRVNICIILKYQRMLNKGPGRTGQIVVYFAKKSVINSLRQVRPVIFRSTKFCQGLPNFKDAVVLPRSRTNFCQAWNLSDLSIYTPWFEGTCQSRKFDLYFWSEYFSPKPMWLTLVVNKYFAVIQCAHTWQIKNLAETNFVEIFGRAKQILSVQCVRTQSQPVHGQNSTIS